MSAEEFDPGRCKSFAFGGGQCGLDAGHDGKHYREWATTGGGFSWTDEGQRALAAKWGSGRD